MVLESSEYKPIGSPMPTKFSTIRDFEKVYDSDLVPNTNKTEIVLTINLIEILTYWLCLFLNFSIYLLLFKYKRKNKQKQGID